MSLHSPENVFRCCLKALLPILKEFVCSHLKRHYGSRYEERLPRPIADLDTSAFLGVAIEHWGAVFRDHVTGDVKTHLFSIKDVRNRMSHDKVVTDEEYQIAIGTIRIFAKKIGGDKATTTIDSCLPQLPGPAIDPRGLTYGDVVNKEVYCPACIPNMVFKSWPMGWDAHAASASACRGLTETGPEARKKEFHSRFAKLFP